jgi:pimeloyl-ACP methyl ester carboxylesterase
LERLHLLYKASSLSYIRFGSGPRPAFCFHGYGEEAVAFAFLEKYAGNEYTFFGVDLPFHGHTEWNDGLSCSTSDIMQIIEKILQENGQQPTTINGHPVTSAERLSKDRQLSLIGYSLGGRVALSLYEKMASQIERLVLLAPDGLKVNFWYWLSTQTWIGNKLFAFTMNHPGWLFGFLRMLNTLKLVNASIFKFVNYYIGDKEARWLLYARWTTLRNLRPGLQKIKSLINGSKTTVRLIYGKHDRIILSSVGEKFKKGIEEHCTISVIHSGHQVLHEKHAGEILPALLH